MLGIGIVGVGVCIASTSAPCRDQRLGGRIAQSALSKLYKELSALVSVSKEPRGDDHDGKPGRIGREIREHMIAYIVTSVLVGDWARRTRIVIYAAVRRMRTC